MLEKWITATLLLYRHDLDMWKSLRKPFSASFSQKRVTLMAAIIGTQLAWLLIRISDKRHFNVSFVRIKSEKYIKI